MPGGPIPPGFFQVCAGPWVGPVLLSLQASLRREGGRERGVSSSSVCHGLNTVALCWFEPFPFHPFLHPFQNPRRGEKRWRADSSCLCWSLFSSRPLHSQTQPPLVRQAAGCFQAHVELSFHKGVLFLKLVNRSLFLFCCCCRCHCLLCLSKLQTLGVM